MQNQNREFGELFEGSGTSTSSTVHPDKVRNGQDPQS
jgi:hypothetical protein